MKRSLSVLVAIFLLLPGMATAQPKGPGRGPGMGPGMGMKGNPHGGGDPFLTGKLEMIRLHLKLSDKQVADVQALQMKYMKLMLQLQKQLVVVKFDLKALVFEPAIDATKAKALFAREATLMADKKMLRLQFLLEAEKLLTADQKKLARMMFIQHMHGGHGR
ncbi:periplasmic heavy metal sensor [Myxococcota bacterium]|nr:periplasmic heavy metal sensor [Myxococcota bacterium]MBU1411859.1 periplasmic heavy metal sensor [Myxococcota bacterium]MBU1511086.1 periplasmic heavy metal sensor [Myxococcota bacterium]